MAGGIAGEGQLNKRLRGLGRNLCAAAALLALAAPAYAIDPIPADARIAPDPALKTGAFANGLRYAVMRNSGPPGAISIRLAFRAGSFDESDSELGYAHFIEHMAFRSTRQAPQGSLDTRFAALGVDFGRDLNAFTGLDSTVYRMDVPRGGTAALPGVLEWLRGAADGILFTPASIEVEKGVVLAEIRARRNPASIAAAEIQHFQGPEVRSLHRDPGGTEASIQGATPAALQAFYDRWYRPENATLIIVGDAPEEELIKAGEKAFGDWKPRGAAAARTPAPEKLAPRTLDVLTRADPALPAAVSACRGTPLPGPRDGSFAQLRRDTLSTLWTAILSSRLDQASSKTGSPLLGALAAVNDGLPDSRFACLVVIPNDGKWREALAVGQAELRRFAADGPTQAEIDTAAEQLRSRLRAVEYQSATRTTTAIADSVLEADSSRRPFSHPTEAMRVFDLLVSGATPADLKQSFERDWSGTGPFVALAAPTAVPKEELLAAWTANEGAERLTAYADREAEEWAYGKWGKRGKVSARQIVSDGGFTRFTFKNGIILNHKQTSFEAGAVEVRVRFGRGETSLSPAERFPVQLAAGVFPLGGLGRMDMHQIARALPYLDNAAKLNVETSAFVLGGSSLDSSFEDQLHLLAAYLTDPGFGPAIDEKLPTSLDFVYRLYSTEPSAIAQDALEGALFPGLRSLPPREELERYKAADFARMLKPVLTTAPIEVTVVGDVDEATVRKAVAKTLGALPRRAPLAPASGPGPFRRFPAQLPPPVTGLHKGASDKAAAILTWPLYVANPERRPEEYAIGLLRSIFQTRLLHEVRAVMGKVYSPSVSNVMPDDADQGFLSATLEATPDDLPALVSATRKLSAELAAGKISPEELDAARSPLLSINDRALRDNESWAGVISHSYRQPLAMRELIGFRADLEALTLEDVRRAAATWLTPQPFLAQALPAPASAKGGPAGR